MKQIYNKLRFYKQWILSVVMVRYYRLINIRTLIKQNRCKHEKGAWLDDHCGVSYHECKKCGKMLIYW